MKALQNAIAKRERDYAKAIDDLRDGADESEDYDHDIDGAERAMREAVELVRCLRRLLDGRTIQEIHKAFGAPGDFGYETTIGDALSRLYRGES